MGNYLFGTKSIEEKEVFIGFPVKGNFSFIKDPYDLEMLQWDYNVIEQNNLWKYFKNHDLKEPFMFSNEINNYNWYNGHSGASWALSMRVMERIAKDGWENFITNYDQ
jgi:hypothetical protein